MSYPVDYCGIDILHPCYATETERNPFTDGVIFNIVQQQEQREMR